MIQWKYYEKNLYCKWFYIVHEHKYLNKILSKNLDLNLESIVDSKTYKKIEQKKDNKTNKVKVNVNYNKKESNLDLDLDKTYNGIRSINLASNLGLDLSKESRRGKLLSNIISYFFDSAGKNNLDNKKVNKVVKGFQYLLKKDPKQKDNRCFICEED